MKVMPMSAVKVLPELLRFFGTRGKEGKRSTIRPAWKIIKLKKGFSSGYIHYSDETVYGDLAKSVLWKGNGFVAVPKPPRFKVGELAQVMWHQRTSPKGSWFCSMCGERLEWFEEGKAHIIAPHEMGDCKGMKKFPKILGTAKITEVFKIEMIKESMDSVNDAFLIIKDGRYVQGNVFYEELAKRDGFKTSQEMFEWFDKTHDLSVPKPFWVYGGWEHEG